MRRLEARVLVVGGGPAGSSAALALSASGVETILLERFPAAQKPCGGAIPSGAFRQLGLPEELLTCKVNSMRVFPPRTDPYDIQFEDGFIGIVDRSRFDSFLRDRCAAEGAGVVAGVFSGFVRRQGARIVSEADVNGEKTEIMSECVIAADGVNSRVRAALGMKPVSSLFTLSANIPLRSERCDFYFGKASAGGYSWLFPSGEASSAGSGSVEPGGLGAGFRDFVSSLGLAGNGIRPRGYRIPVWEGELLVAGRILFCGDAAGLVMPFTFEGIYYAMRSGQMAAEAIIKGALQDYRKLWRRSFRMRFMIMKEIWSRYLQEESSMERLLGVIRNQQVQKSAVRLWLEKSQDRKSLLSFVNSLRKFRLF